MSSDNAETNTFEVPMDGSFFQDPYSVYRTLRSHGPVHQVRGRGGTNWLVVGYDAIRAGLTDLRLSKSGEAFAKRAHAKMGEVTSEVVSDTMALNDSFASLVREVVARHLGSPANGNPRERFTEIANALLDSVARPEVPVDLVSQFALPYAVRVASEVAGIPEHDRADFIEWFRIDAMSDDDRYTDRTVFKQMHRRITGLLTERQIEPQEDLITALAAKITSGAGATEEHVASSTTYILLRWVTNICDCVVNSFHDLLTNPNQLKKLLDDDLLVAPAIDELLRLNATTIMSAARIATEDLRLAGADIAAGDVVFFALGSGNHDDTHFADPDVLDVTRCPQDHFGFGLGRHRCPAIGYAQQQTETALRVVLRRFPALRLAADPAELVWYASAFRHTLKSLPVVLRP